MMLDPVVTPKSLWAQGSAALLAFFVAACQPAANEAAKSEAPAPVAEDASAAPAGAASSPYAAFAKGELAKLAFDGGTRLPPSPMLDAAGGERKLAEYEGKVVVLNIWGEWCAPCVDEMPTLAALQQAFPDGDVAVVPVAFGEPDARVTAAAKLKELAGDVLPFFYDSEFNVSADAKTGAFPSTIIYDRTGAEVARLIYPADWASEDAKALVRAVLGQPG